MTDAEFFSRIVADMAAAEELPPEFHFVVPAWWPEKPELLPMLQGMVRNGQQVLVQQYLNVEPVPLDQWLQGVRRRPRPS